MRTAQLRTYIKMTSFNIFKPGMPGEKNMPILVRRVIEIRKSIGRTTYRIATLASFPEFSPPTALARDGI